MGNDFYETPDEIAQPTRRRPSAAGRRRRIAHRRARSSTRTAASAATCESINERGVDNTEETPCGMIRDGIVVTAKNTALPDGWRMLDTGYSPREDGM